MDDLGVGEEGGSEEVVDDEEAEEECLDDEERSDNEVGKAASKAWRLNGLRGFKLLNGSLMSTAREA
jgi:hypothetical protein